MYFFWGVFSRNDITRPCSMLIYYPRSAHPWKLHLCNKDNPYFFSTFYIPPIHFIYRILDDVEFYEQQVPFHLEELLTIGAFLRQFIVKVIWNRLVEGDTFSVCFAFVSDPLQKNCSSNHRAIRFSPICRLNLWKLLATFYTWCNLVINYTVGRIDQNSLVLSWFTFCTTDPNSPMYQVFESAHNLLMMLYDRDARRSFTPPGHWLSKWATFLVLLIASFCNVFQEETRSSYDFMINDLFTRSFIHTFVDVAAIVYFGKIPVIHSDQIRNLCIKHYCLSALHFFYEKIRFK